MIGRVAPLLQPGHVVRADAPIRICDNGGWTDTWFAGHGSVFNVAVTPRVEVEARVLAGSAAGERVVLDVVNYGDRYAFDPASPPGHHPLLEAVIEDVGLPDRTSVEISVRSQVPPGSSTGTSAAVTVALVGALDALTPGRLVLDEVARIAHHIEVEVLGAESGVQDQLSAAFGGVNSIEISSYPHATVTRLQLSASTRAELEARLVLVYLGQAHASSQVHEQVITAVTSRQHAARNALDELRSAARDARDAVLAGDFLALGHALRRNCDAQAGLHPDLVGPDAEMAIQIAAAHGALGWKVNGAGGRGGSVTLLCRTDPEARRALDQALRAADPRFAVIPTTLSSTGLHVRSRAVSPLSPSAESRQDREPREPVEPRPLRAGGRRVTGSPREPGGDR
jgi:D-glycero-alpha-D-manno-heptose-7-phosphate kinase